MRRLRGRFAALLMLSFVVSCRCDPEPGMDAGAGGGRVMGGGAGGGSSGGGSAGGAAATDAGADAGASSDAGDDGGVDGGPSDAGLDAGERDAGVDGGDDGGLFDAGERDASVDGGDDAGSLFDAGLDGGSDAGPRDGGSTSDAGSDGGLDGGRDAGTDAGFDAGVLVGRCDSGPCGEGPALCPTAACQAGLVCVDGGSVFYGGGAGAACASTCPRRSGDGLTARYYVGPLELPDGGPVLSADGGLPEPLITTIEGPVDVNWGFNAARPGLPTGLYTAQWAGFLVAPASGPYDLCSTHTSGSVRVFVGGARVFTGTSSGCSAPVSLIAGQRVALLMTYQHTSGFASARLSWRPSGSSTLTTVPLSALFSEDSHLVATERCERIADTCLATSAPYCDVELENRWFVSRDCLSNADCPTSSCDLVEHRCVLPPVPSCDGGPGAGVQTSYFTNALQTATSLVQTVVEGPVGSAVPPGLTFGWSTRSTAFLRPPLSDLYELCLVNDGTLSINGNVELRGSGCTPQRLIAGRDYELEITLTTLSISSPPSLNWRSASIPFSPVPAAVLFPIPHRVLADGGFERGSLRWGPSLDGGSSHLTPSGAPLTVPSVCGVIGPVPASCTNGLFDRGSEQNTDCGGVCPRSCSRWTTCERDTDCQGRLACVNGTCVDRCVDVTPAGGLRARWYGPERTFGTTFVDPPSFVMTDPGIDRPARVGSPELNVSGRPFGVVWDGWLIVPSSGSYRFDAAFPTGDLSTLTIGGTVVTSSTQPLVLSAGRVPLSWTVLSLSSAPAFRLSWSRPGDLAFSVIPASSLTSVLAPCECSGASCSASCSIDKPCLTGQGPCAGDTTCAGGTSCGSSGRCEDGCQTGVGTGVLVEDYASSTFTNFLGSALAPDIRTPGPSVRARRITGAFRAERTEDHVFCIGTSSTARLFIQDQLVADESRCSGRLSFVAGRRYPFRLEVSSQGTIFTLGLTVQTPSHASVPVPAAQLFPAGTSICGVRSAPATCTNGLFDPGSELDLDCGGACPPCPDCQLVCSAQCQCGAGSSCSSSDGCSGRLECGPSMSCADTCPQLFGDGLWAEYFTPDGIWNASVSPPITTGHPAAARIESTVDNGVAAPSWIAARGAPWVVSWSGELVAPITGLYNFAFASSATSISLFIGAQPITSPTQNVSLTAGATRPRSGHRVLHLVRSAAVARPPMAHPARRDAPHHSDAGALLAPRRVRVHSRRAVPTHLHRRQALSRRPRQLHHRRDLHRRSALRPEQRPGRGVRSHR